MFKGGCDKDRPSLEAHTSSMLALDGLLPLYFDEVEGQLFFEPPYPDMNAFAQMVIDGTHYGAQDSHLGSN